LEVQIMRQFMKAAIFAILLLSVPTARLAAEGTVGLSQSHKIFVDGLWLAYQDVGRGTPVVLVPGSLSDFRIWFNQIGPFSQHHRVIAYSRRYTWPNVAPGPGADASVARQVDDLAALITGLGIRPAHVVGHSYAGLIALILALQHPELVRTLVLEEPTVPSMLAAAPGSESDLKSFQDFGAALQPALASGEAERIASTVINFVAPGAFASMPPEMHAMFVGNAPSYRAEAGPRPPVTCQDVARITVPTLVLTGERSPSGFRHIAAIVANCAPRGNIAMIPRAGHPMQLDNPQVFNETVLTFLAQH
jgi:pimeloyl-ACP methyl ester carboxylesterase